MAEGETAYLRASCSVLSGTTSDELGVVVLEQIFVETHVLLLGEDGVVGLQAVLLEELLISAEGGR